MVSADRQGVHERVMQARRFGALFASGPFRRFWLGFTVSAVGDAMSDLGIRLASKRLGLGASLQAIERRAESWRPWRAYAAMHLWEGLAELEPR